MKFNGKKGASELSCSLRSGIEETSLDLDKLIGTSHMLIEGPQAPQVRDKNVSPFSKQELSSSS